MAELLPFSQVGGFAAGVRLLSLAGIPLKAGALSLFADLLMEFFGKLLYAIVGLALLVWLRPGNPPAPYPLVTLGLLAGASVLPLHLRGFFLRFAPRFLRRWIPDNASDRFLPFLAPQCVAPSFVLHVICWGLGGLEARVTLHLMGVQVDVLQSLAIDSLVMGLRTFGFWIPAALGVQEAACVLVCALFGLSAQAAIALSLIRRARDILLGVLGLAVWQGMESIRTRRASLMLDLEAAPEP